MSTDVLTVGPEETANAAWSRMQRADVRHLVVAEGERLIGVLSERDLGGPKGSAVRKGRTVRDLMTPQVATATPETTLRKAANLMHGRLIGSLPVVDDDGRLVGIVTATDVLQELGRGSTRPEVRAARRSMRLPPAGARRAAAAKRSPAAKREKRTPQRTGKPRKESDDGDVPGDGEQKVTGRIAPALGRDRSRRPDSEKRAPMARFVSRPAKRTAGRTGPSETPAYIRVDGADVEAEDRAYVRRKLGRKLGKFASHIERTSVRIKDVNGPRGGIDKRCRIKVVLSGLPSVVVEESHESLQAAIDGALARVERAVRQATDRRRRRG